jgi:hypothetical protein
MINRYVSPVIAFRAFFSSIYAKISVPLLLGACVFTTVMVLTADFTSFKFSGDVPLETTSGLIVAIEPTNTSINDEQVYAYHFQYTVPDDETERAGVSYYTGNASLNTNMVEVEYRADSPEIARIKGMRSGIMPAFIALFALPFFIMAVFMGILGFKQGKLVRELLPHGEITAGRMLMQKATNTRINNRQVMACEFEYQVDGVPYKVVGKTHLPEKITDEPEERILYNPLNPSRAVLFDLLPARLQAFIEREM